MLKADEKKRLNCYIVYTVTSIIAFAALTVIHSWISYNQIQAVNFIVPVFAGLVVGVLMARNKVLRTQLSQLANTDKLTGACNRLYFDKRLAEEVDRARRYKQHFCIIYLDLDFFKKVNDQFGHGIGDEVLIDFAAIIKKVNRESDVLARFGGEEFIILAQMADKDSVLKLYERIKTATDQHTFKKVKNITFSAGIAEFDIEKDSARSLLERADKALYKAKDNGRNQAVIAD